MKKISLPKKKDTALSPAENIAEEKPVKAPKEKPVKTKKEKPVKVKKEKPIKEKPVKEKSPKVQKEKNPNKKPNPILEILGKLNLGSMRFKIIAIVFVSILATVVITSNVIISYSKSLVVDSAYGKMLNIVSSYGTLVDKTENGELLTDEEYTELLKDVTLEGNESANCFLLNKSGIITYSGETEKIGKPNKNPAITEVIADINKGKVPDNLCMEYNDEGVDKYASFFICPSTRSVLVMDVAASDLMSPINDLISKTIILAIFIIIVAMAITLFIVNNITRPLKQVTNIINDTAQLKLATPQGLSKLCARKDETGEISRAVKVMSSNLKDVVSKIDLANQSIEEDMHKLEESSNQVNIFCTENSSTADQLAASTENMAKSLTDISSHMDEMKYKSESIGVVTTKSNSISEEIAARAQNMQTTTREAIQKTREMYDQLKEKTDIALEGLKSVSKINELTNAISEISDQTSLLSLNASIEAARAGDAGRGFAVVASEISNLANKSMENVNDINAIIQEINGAVANISKTMEETSLFLEKNVLADYDSFNNIGNQYQSDADVFKNTMTQISSEMDALNDSITLIVNNLEGVQATMTNTSNGVNDIANKTSNVVHATADNYELTNNTVLSVDDLKSIVTRFQF